MKQNLLKNQPYWIKLRQEHGQVTTDWFTLMKRVLLHHLRYSTGGVPGENHMTLSLIAIADVPFSGL